MVSPATCWPASKSRNFRLPLRCLLRLQLLVTEVGRFITTVAHPGVLSVCGWILERPAAVLVSRFSTDTFASNPQVAFVVVEKLSTCQSEPPPNMCRPPHLLRALLSHLCHVRRDLLAVCESHPHRQSFLVGIVRYGVDNLHAFFPRSYRQAILVSLLFGCSSAALGRRRRRRTCGRVCRLAFRAFCGFGFWFVLCWIASNAPVIILEYIICAIHPLVM